MSKRPNPLETYFKKNDDRLIHKWHHYFEIYHRHFERFRGTKPVVLEFGVSQGGSLRMWRDYFGRGTKIYGADIHPRSRELEERNTRIFVGDQEDRTFLREIADEIGRPIDVVIEDGGHFPRQQIHTFEEIYPRMSPDGCFLIEDLHTSYWPKYEGGLYRPETFMEYAKPLTDKLNAWHSSELKVDKFTRTTKSMHFYDSILVFERGKVVKPTHEKRGELTVADPEWKAPATKRLRNAVRRSRSLRGPFRHHLGADLD